MDIHFRIKDTPNDGFSVIGSSYVPRVGEFVYYEYRPSDPEKWTRESIEKNERVSGARYIVCSIEHEFIFHDIGDQHHVIQVYLERSTL